MSALRTTSRRLAVGLVGVIALAACGGESAGPAADDAAVGAAPTAAPAPPDGQPAAAAGALDFTAPLLDGGEIEMGQFAGRPVLLWFWAPW